jgi:CBS domain containing-hemolysin-like protein
MIAPAILVIAVLLAPAVLLVRGTDRRAGYLRGGFHVASMIGFTSAGWLLVRSESVGAQLAFVLFGFCWTGPFWIASLRNRHLGSVMAAPPPEEAEPDGESLPEEGLDPQGQRFLDRLLELSRIQVGELATPRDRIVYAECSEGLGNAIGRIRQSGFLRVPMVDGGLDRIVGVVHAKDIVRIVHGGRATPPLRSVMRRAFFISHTAPAASLLELFRSQRGHLAIVVDEYSRTVGLVTRSDCFRHLSGDEGDAP